MKTYGKMQICSSPFYQHKSKSAAGGRGAVRWSKNNYGNARQITNNEQNDRSNADAEWFWIENKQIGQLLLQFCLNGQLIIAIRSLIKQRCQQTTIFPAKFLIFFVYTYLSFWKCATLFTTYDRKRVTYRCADVLWALRKEAINFRWQNNQHKQIFNTFSMIKDNMNKTYTFAKNDKIMIWVRVNVFEIKQSNCQ